MSYGVQNNDDIALQFGTRFCPYGNMLGFLGAAGVGVFDGVGDAPEAAIGVAAAELAATILTEGDEIADMIPIPNEWDMTADIYARVWWFHDAAATDENITFTFSHRFYAAAEAMVAMPAGTDGDVTLSAGATGGTAGSIEVTPWTNLLTVATYASGDVAMAYTVANLSNGEADDAEIELTGVEFKFKHNLLTGGNRWT